MINLGVAIAAGGFFLYFLITLWALGGGSP